MTQETVAGRIYVELEALGIINEEHQLIVHTYLMQAYAIGFDTGRMVHSHQKPVAQFSLDGKLVELYKSAAEASRRTKIDNGDISKCASGKAYTAGKFLWEYINKSTPTSELGTVGSLLSKRAQTKPKNQFSKKV